MQVLVEFVKGDRWFLGGNKLQGRHRYSVDIFRTYCIFETETIVGFGDDRENLKVETMKSQQDLKTDRSFRNHNIQPLYSGTTSCVTVGAVFGMFHHSLGSQGFQTLRSKLLEASATIAPNNALLFSKFADARGKILHGHFFRRRTSG